MADNETQVQQRPNTTGKPFENEGAPGIPYYTPLTNPSIGTLLSTEEFPKNKDVPLAFKPLKLKGIEAKNRIWVSPMCQYSSPSGTGLLTDWHVVNAGSFARGGAGIVTIEATAVLDNGGITPEDSGIWGDQHIEPLKRVVDFIHSQGALASLQLAHAGRKASTWAPWVTDGLITPIHPHKPDSPIVPDDKHGFRNRVWGASAIPFNDQHAVPKEITKEEIETLVKGFEAATIRAEKAGFDIVEVHGAHGYLLHNFISPLSNQRKDEFGGSFENRIRLPLEVSKVVRKAWPSHKPVFYRVSATDWYDKGERDASGEYISWGIEQTVEFAKRLQKEADITLLDVSTGGNFVGQQIPLKPGYQVEFAQAVKKAVPELLIGTVGLITEGKQVEEILQKGEADAIFAARQWLRDPHWALTIAGELGVAVATPVQYQRAYTRLYK